MSLLQMALKAGLPLIKVTTTDTLNSKAVLSFLCDINVTEITDSKSLETTTSKYCMANSVAGSVESLYSYLISEERTVILVNSEDESPLIFDAGELPVPREMVLQHLTSVLNDEKAEEVLAATGGLTLKEVSEVARMAMAEYGCLTPRGVMAIRRSLMSRLKGLFQADTSMEYYRYCPAVSKWLADNKSIFKHCSEHRLIPRGLLFYGPPGTGKTMSAKYIASELQVPLWVLDLGSTMGRYVGDSEGQLNRNLQQIDCEAPGVLLLDEVEKVFGGSHDDGVAGRMLQKLLWWLQEHRSRILTIMTTNDITAIPPELYREGRVDSKLVFDGLMVQECHVFASDLIDSFTFLSGTGGKKARKAILSGVDARAAQYPSATRIAQGRVSQWVYDLIKEEVNKGTVVM